MTAMKQKRAAPAALEAQYRRLARSLGQVGFISQGTVFERKRPGSGSRYQWTWKNRKQKTISLTLSAKQFAWLKAALGRQRQMEKTLRQMRRISCRVLLNHVAGPARRKPLSMKQLGLI
jgi:hypothetical protein